MEVDEFQVAQLFMVVKASAENTGGGEGVEVITNEPFDNEDGAMGRSEMSDVDIPTRKGQYTLKNYFLASKVPSIIKKIAPTEALILREEAWNCYPYCLTVLTSAWATPQRFRIVVETMHAPDNGNQENAVGLNDAELKERIVEFIDIAAPVPENEYNEKEDPTTYMSEKTGRGQLADGWFEDREPMMCAYKVIKVNFAFWGFQGKVEDIIKNFQRKLFKTTLRQSFCLTDEWYGLNMEDIRRLEDEAKDALDAARAEGEIKNNFGEV
jgi:hypothetical protein